MKSIIKDEVLVHVDSHAPHIEDDADGPDVDGAIVALVLEHFWRQIRRRADERAPERLLGNNACEAEVAEFNLRVVCKRTSTRADALELGGTKRDANEPPPSARGGEARCTRVSEPSGTECRCAGAARSRA